LPKAQLARHPRLLLGHPRSKGGGVKRLNPQKRHQPFHICASQPPRLADLGRALKKAFAHRAPILAAQRLGKGAKAQITHHRPAHPRPVPQHCSGDQAHNRKVQPQRNRQRNPQAPPRLRARLIRLWCLTLRSHHGTSSKRASRPGIMSISVISSPKAAPRNAGSTGTAKPM
jgi:hypothetical protein